MYTPPGRYCGYAGGDTGILLQLYYGRSALHECLFFLRFCVLPFHQKAVNWNRLVSCHQHEHSGSCLILPSLSAAFKNFTTPSHGQLQLICSTLTQSNFCADIECIFQINRIIRDHGKMNEAELTFHISPPAFRQQHTNGGREPGEGLIQF